MFQAARRGPGKVRQQPIAPVNEEPFEKEIQTEGEENQAENGAAAVGHFFPREMHRYARRKLRAEATRDFC